MHAIATTTSTSTLTATATATATASTLTGQRLIPADLCQYADVVQAGDVLRVNFDINNTVSRSGLHLVEFVNAEGVAWMGCRRFDRRLDGLSMDESGRGDWRDVPSLSGAGLRVAGFVEKVYRAC